MCERWVFHHYSPARRARPRAQLYKARWPPGPVLGGRAAVVNNGGASCRLCHGVTFTILIRDFVQKYVLPVFKITLLKLL